jgi:EAL domain-containing protein (putative c-di-GMP-specific phosphodiesterase class I)
VNSAAYGADLDHMLGENSWLRDRLMFEITESSRIDDLRAANQFVLKLRSSGYAVCLDDFGAGAANFQYLASLDVDIVKLDGAAVRCAQRSAKGMAFLKALVGLCRELGIGTVIEMVDSPASLQFARACGANYVQGYLFGKPHADIGLFERIVPRDLFRTSQPE